MHSSKYLLSTYPERKGIPFLAQMIPHHTEVIVKKSLYTMPLSSLQGWQAVKLAVSAAGERVVKPLYPIVGITGFRLRHSVDYSRLIARESKE